MTNTLEIPVDWLLDSDPAIRWQVLAGLTDADPEAVGVERSRVADEGWGGRLLDLQADDGNWGGGSYTPKWTSTTYTLLLLRHFGAPPGHPRVKRAIERVGEGVVMGRKPVPFFTYANELCITSMALALGSYFLDDPTTLPQPEVLLGAQLEDGGWNCHRQSTRSSFNTTISALEGIAEHERALGGDRDLTEARGRAHEYLLERRLMYSLTTDELINRRWQLFSFPPRWHYDVLRALDYLRLTTDPDPRCDEAIDLLRSKQRRDGRWTVQNRHPGKEHFSMEETGKPSRWNTLRAAGVLEWYGGVA